MGKILVIEDEKAIRETLCGFLTLAGHDARGAENGHAGIAAAISFLPDLILCDVNMPELDGHGVLEALRANSETAATAFVFLTSRSDHSDVRQGMNLGADDYLTKPFRRAELLEAVTARLKRQQAVSSREQARVLAEGNRLRDLLDQDAVTGLPSRLSLPSRFADVMLQTGGAAGVVVVGVERYYELVAGMEGSAVDGLARGVAERLVAAVGAHGHVVRLQPDEFAVLARADVDAHATQRMAETLVNCLDTAVDVVGRPVPLRCSVGVALAPLHGKEVESLVRGATRAMRQASRARPGSWALASDKRTGPFASRYELEAGMRTALVKGGYELHYQPKVDLASMTMHGAEALIRWRLPDGRLVAPGDFIPAAEESGLIVQLGDWVLRDALGQLQRWHAAGREIHVAVNISAQQLLRPDFLRKLRDLMAEARLPTSTLELEITETTLLKDMDEAIKTLKHARDEGFSISLDDFGTGYSSLSYLSRLPLHVLKLDRSFVAGLPGDGHAVAIVDAILEMGHQLGLRIVAEGVETVEGARFLAQRGCDAIQGYVFSRPLPPPDLDLWVSNPTWKTLLN